MAKALNVGIVGTGFMGRAHSQAWASVNRFFSDLPAHVNMKTACGTDASRTRDFAKRWGWSNATTDALCVCEDLELDLVDLLTPNHLHAEHAIAVLRAGLNVACEKPLAGTLADARAMRDAARKHKRLKTFVWFNYRRAPAVAFSHQLVRRGKIGRIFHVRAQYLQEWGGAATPLSWRYQGKLAGSGAHGDLNAHIIDMTRFITGEEITEISGAIEETFIRNRRSVGKSGKVAPSTVDDCVLFLARFSGGAVASFEATRLATGNYNRNGFEINGEKGAIRFDFERMNELQWWDATLEPGLRGWSTINCSVAGSHPYLEAYWPTGHGIGYEHTFISQAADIVRALSGKKPAVPLPDFEDAYQTQRVLEAALRAARHKRAVKMSEVTEQRAPGDSLALQRREACMATDHSSATSLAGPGVMLFSAAIFGYFGFATTWLTTSSITGQFLLFVAIFEWTLKAGAIAFFASALLTFALPLLGNALYALASAASAVTMAIVLVLDFKDKQHTVMPEIVLLIMVVWNLWGAWSSVREVMAAASQRDRSRREQFLPPG